MGGFMKLCRSLGIILALACLQSAVAQTSDTIWACREDTNETYYRQMFLSDTFPDNRDSFAMVDTGDVLEGKYVNFDYKFTAADSGFYYDTVTDTLGNPLIVSGYRNHPGYAGFKFYWDHGICQFWVADFDSMILWHKGPLPGHKVRMIWAQGSAGCGTPINYECFGEFASSTSWTRESFPFPKKRNYGAAPDSQFVKNGLFELRMQIYNDSTITTDPTSPPGNLKIDNMFFYRPPAHPPELWQQPESQTVEVGSQVFIQVLALGGVGDSGVMTYLWKKDGNPITETTARYVINSAQSSDAGTYTVVVTNSFGSVTSDAAILTVNTKTTEKKNCGCGSGTGLALIPPLFFKAMAQRKRKKKNPKT
jgi:hypothetical protein